MKKYKLILTLFFFITSAIYGEYSLVYECKKTSEKITIDGILDEKCWKDAGTLNFFIPVNGQPALSKSEGKILRDDDFIYVSIKAFDQDIKSKFTKRDSSTYKDDCLEIFFMDCNSTETISKNSACYNFEINALGTILDAFHPDHYAFKEYRDEQAVGVLDWNCTKMQIGIKIEGTINDDTDEDKFWTIEVAIPFAGMPSLNNKSPKDDDIWHFLLARYDYSKYLPQGKELSATSKLSAVKFHNFHDWMKLKFSK